MSSLLIENGCVVTHNENNEVLERAAVYVEGETIAAVGPDAAGRKADKVIDARGRIVMPGLINAHHHLYSTFARGFAPPGEPARNFKEILERLWWKLDLALSEEDVYYSSVLPLIDCVKMGCTTVIDHHASPSCRDGSLDIVEKAFRDVGLNGCLCYEVSDRNVEGGGVQENERFLVKCMKSGDGQVAGLFGLHASMTIGDATLERCAGAGLAMGAGFHVHAAEDEIDQVETMRKHGCRVIERFHEAGVTGLKSIFVHCVHLDERESEILQGSGSIVVHNPESNMNNAVGVARVLDLLDRGVLVGIGTDGMSSDMISSARAAYLLQRHALGDPRVAFLEACGMLLKNNRIIANRIFPEQRGILEAGRLADIAIVDYKPFTPFNGNTFCGHLLFGLVDAVVDTTICRGKILMEDRRLQSVDEDAVCRKARELAPKLWARIE